MDFELSKEHQLLRELYRSFAQNEVKPHAEETDEQERFPVETVKLLGRYGFMGIPYPKEYGGLRNGYRRTFKGVRHYRRGSIRSHLLVLRTHL